jgi:hypothetical protein
MSRMDWDVMVADLEEKRTAAAQEVSDIDAVIEAVRRRANGAATPAPKSKAAPAHKNGRAKAKPATNGGRTKLDPALLARVSQAVRGRRTDRADPRGQGPQLELDLSARERRSVEARRESEVCPP